VSKGVNVADQVVVEGQAQLRPGAKIAAKPAPPQTSGSPPGSASAGAPGDAPSSPP
jgi:hypothetical protein